MKKGGVLRAFDLYQKIPKDLTETTEQGGCFSIFAAIFMVILFHVEIFAFILQGTDSSVMVDNVQEEKLRINFNLTMLDLPCEFAVVDALDVLGMNRPNISRDIDKWHLDSRGVVQAYQGRNREQDHILHFDENHVDLQALHENGVHAVPLNEDTYDMWLDEHDFSFTVYHAPWCIWCRKLLPTWEALAEEVERRGMNVAVTAVDCVANAEICEDQGIKWWPVVRLHMGPETLHSEYGGDRSVDAMMAFLNQQLNKVATSARGAKLTLEQGVHDDTWPGCMVSGSILVNRVPGNFHIEARSNAHNMHPAMTNLSHVVHHLSFGEPMTRRVTRKVKRLEEEHRQLSTMDGTAYVVNEYHEAPHHYIKVVGTTYSLIGIGGPWKAYQMVDSHQVMQYHPHEVPEARFAYTISPMSVLLRPEGHKWYEFVTKLLAIVGGTFSMVGLFDAAVFRASKRRRELNK